MTRSEWPKQLICTSIKHLIEELIIYVTKYKGEKKNPSKTKHVNLFRRRYVITLDDLQKSEGKFLLFEVGKKSTFQS